MYVYKIINKNKRNNYKKIKCSNYKKIINYKKSMSLWIFGSDLYDALHFTPNNSDSVIKMGPFPYTNHWIIAETKHVIIEKVKVTSQSLIFFKK